MKEVGQSPFLSIYAQQMQMQCMHSDLPYLFQCNNTSTSPALFVLCSGRPLCYKWAPNYAQESECDSFKLKQSTGIYIVVSEKYLGQVHLDIGQTQPKSKFGEHTIEPNMTPIGP